MNVLTSASSGKQGIPAPPIAWDPWRDYDFLAGVVQRYVVICIVISFNVFLLLLSGTKTLQREHNSMFLSIEYPVTDVETFVNAAHCVHDLHVRIHFVVVVRKS